MELTISKYVFVRIFDSAIAFCAIDLVKKSRLASYSS